MNEKNKYYVCSKCKRLMPAEMYTMKAISRDLNTKIINYGRYCRCKVCISNAIDDTDEKTIKPILKELNYPYIRKQWQRILEADKSRVLSYKNTECKHTILWKYISLMRLCSFKMYSYTDSKELNKRMK